MTASTASIVHSPAVFLALMLLAGILAGAAYHENVRTRPWRCDACRIEHGGGAALFMPHSCSRRHAFYRDAEGVVHEFGRPTRRRERAA